MKEWFQGKTVAIVGNAMSLFDKEYGSEIDSHDVVVRLNKAAMLYDRYDAEKSHGNRTDVWMFWRTGEYKTNFSRIDKRVKKMHMSYQERNQAYTKECDFIYPDTLHRALKQKVGKHNNPTTGIMAIDYVYSCDPAMISIYGFDWKETPTYTDPDRKAEKQCFHDFPAEKQYVHEFFLTKPNVFLRN